MPILYTGKGDAGKSFVGKKSLSKNCIEIESLGDLDELNSLVGLVKSQKLPSEFKRYLHDIQEKLFIIQANAASIIFKSKYEPPFFNPQNTKKLEKLIDKLEADIKPERKFIIPGENNISAWLDYARAVTRRAERSLVKISDKKGFLKDSLAYANRLSSFLFALARYYTKTKEQKEKHPAYK